MRALPAVLIIMLSAGCSTAVEGVPVAANDPQQLIAGYFKAFDDAATKGADAQMTFLQRTQHPDFKNLLCDLGGATIEALPTFSTLKRDPNWAPESGSPPRGEVYVVAVSLSVSKDGQVLGEQIGSERVVVLDGSVYGFMPCLQ